MIMIVCRDRDRNKDVGKGWTRQGVPTSLEIVNSNYALETTTDYTF